MKSLSLVEVVAMYKILTVNISFSLVFGGLSPTKEESLASLRKCPQVFLASDEPWPALKRA